MNCAMKSSLANFWISGLVPRPLLGTPARAQSYQGAVTVQGCWQRLTIRCPHPGV